VLGDRLDPTRLHFHDLDHALVQRELERSRRGERPGPHAEHMLRDVGTVASGARGRTDD
jgi:pyruvate ferredoxin oxidoreductase alpha subunit